MRLQLCLDIEAQKKKKIDIYIFLSIMFKKKGTKIFQTSKGGSKDLCYSSEPVYSPWDEPNKKEKYNISEPLHRRTHVG